MLATPFLTELDSRVAIKGSRDPLGIQPLWTRLGRDVIGNLTTVSNSVPDFAVVLLGFHFIGAVAERRGSEQDLATFLKWEQLAAYARYSQGQRHFRGTERVAQRLNAGGAVRIGTDSGAQILSDQKTYGLWGLYTVPARSSGLIQGDPGRLVPRAREVVDSELLASIDRISPRGVRRLEASLGADAGTFQPAKAADKQLFEAIAKALTQLGPKTRALFRDTLQVGGKSADSTQGCQPLLATLLIDTLREPEWALTPLAVKNLIGAAERNGAAGELLATRLRRILAAESVLAPAASLFQYLLGCHDQNLSFVANNIGQQWGPVFKGTIPRAEVEAWTLGMAGGKELADRWLALAEALASANYADAIECVLQQNADVLQSRAGSAPWIRITDGCLDVRYRDESSANLPVSGDVPNLWRHAYFIQSLRDVAQFLNPRA